MTPRRHDARRRGTSRPRRGRRARLIAVTRPLTGRGGAPCAACRAARPGSWSSTRRSRAERGTRPPGTSSGSRSRDDRRGAGAGAGCARRRRRPPAESRTPPAADRPGRPGRRRAPSAPWRRTGARARSRKVAWPRTRQIRRTAGRGRAGAASSARRGPRGCCIRCRNPCFFFRFRLFGWKVRFTHGLLERAARGGVGAGPEDVRGPARWGVGGCRILRIVRGAPAIRAGRIAPRATRGHRRARSRWSAPHSGLSDGRREPVDSAPNAPLCRPEVGSHSPCWSRGPFARFATPRPIATASIRRTSPEGFPARGRPTVIRSSGAPWPRLVRSPHLWMGSVDNTEVASTTACRDRLRATSGTPAATHCARSWPRGTWNTWFREVRPVRCDGDVLVLAVPNAVACERIRSSYAGLLTDLLRDATGRDLAVELVVDTAPAATTRWS